RDCAEAAVDPTPLDARQMMHDADQRNELPIGSPTRLVVVESFDLAQHRATEVSEPLQEQFLFVARGSWKPDLVDHTRTLITTTVRSQDVQHDDRHSVDKNGIGAMNLAT